MSSARPSVLNGAAGVPAALSSPVGLTAISAPYVSQSHADHTLPSGAQRRVPTVAHVHASVASGVHVVGPRPRRRLPPPEPDVPDVPDVPAEPSGELPAAPADPSGVLSPELPELD